MIITISGPASKRCPYRDELDEGTVTITLDLTYGDGPELHTLSERLVSEDEVSHEQWTDALQDWLMSQCDGRLTSVRVQSAWNTAGMAVTVDVPSDQHQP